MRKKFLSKHIATPNDLLLDRLDGSTNIFNPLQYFSLFSDVSKCIAPVS